MTRIRHLAATLSVLTCTVLAAGAEPSRAWSEMTLWGDLGTRPFEQKLPDESRQIKKEKTAKLQKKRQDGPSFLAQGWRQTKETAESLSFSVRSRLVADAGPHHGEAVDSNTGRTENAAAAGVSTTVYKDFAFSKPTRFRFVHTLAYRGDTRAFRPATGELWIYEKKKGFMDRAAMTGFIRAGADCYTGILPAGSYQVHLHLGGISSTGGAEEKQRDLTVSLESRLDFGPLSKPALGWQKVLTKFSDSAVLLRLAADRLDAGVEKQRKQLRIAGRNTPAAFDAAFTAVPQPGKSGLFSLVPTGEAGDSTRQFVTAASGAVSDHDESRADRQDFTRLARTAVEKGLLPRTVLLQLKWQVPALPAGIAEEAEWIASITELDHTAAQVNEARERYGAAVVTLGGGLPLVGEGVDGLEGRQDFIVPAIGLAAEELVRELKADTRLTAREKEILLGGLDLAAWTWER
ncbi:MAG: hypothetical protein EOP88_26315 [Verrucomicrobiaceae bacterium]|nr:MAG: hypothetical protein EOP88_26315 [Verrucomicrobiaceae bacterium]